MNDRPVNGPHDGAYLARDSETLGFPRGRTALLVIDPVNDFLSEGGAAWEMTKHTVELHNVVENLQRAISGARAARIPVLFGPMAYTEEDYADAALHRRSGINRLMFETKMFLAGSWGADFHPDLQPEAGDIVLEPHKGTDVFETDLPEHLPLDAVVRRVGKVAFINMPKMVVGKMPWSEPPTPGDRQQKVGPSSADVQRLYRSHSPSSEGSAHPGR